MLRSLLNTWVHANKLTFIYKCRMSFQVENVTLFLIKKKFFLVICNLWNIFVGDGNL